jgi:protein-arginine kinase activator protein McsA
VRREKEAAVEAQEFVRAAELRDRERDLNGQMGADGKDQALADALARLGLA